MMPETSTPALSDRPAGRPFPWPCPRCRQNTVWPVIIPYQGQQAYEGRLYAVNTPRLNIPRCAQCGELLFDNWADDQIDGAFRQQVHLLTPEQIRANRAALGLSLQVLAARLGVEDELLRRWEEDREIQPRAMDNLLRLYFALPPVRTALSGEPCPDFGVCVVP